MKDGVSHVVHLGEDAVKGVIKGVSVAGHAIEHALPVVKSIANEVKHGVHEAAGLASKVSGTAAKFLPLLGPEGQEAATALNNVHTLAALAHTASAGGYMYGRTLSLEDLTPEFVFNIEQALQLSGRPYTIELFDGMGRLVGTLMKGGVYNSFLSTIPSSGLRYGTSNPFKTLPFKRPRLIEESTRSKSPTPQRDYVPPKDWLRGATYSGGPIVTSRVDDYDDDGQTVWCGSDDGEISSTGYSE